MREGDRYYETTPFKELRELADSDWEAFCKLVGEDMLIEASICFMLSRRLTMGTIANRYKVTKRKVQYVIENKCRCRKPPPTNNKNII